MPEITYQFPGDKPQISTFGIHIPDESNLGTGMFTTTFASRAFASSEPFMSAIFNPHIFGIVAAVTPGVGIGVRLHDADGRKPRHQVGFAIPGGLDADVPHTLAIEFVNWRILSATLDGELLAILGNRESH